jgi:hypothetical protein
MSDKDIYKPVKDYANEKGLTVQAVYQAIKRGKLKSKKIGSYTLVKV